jgi:arginyl-tRNA synthetase
MNIFDLYLDKIKNLIKKLNQASLIELPKTLDGINVDIPPVNFNCDISTNVAMVLSKINNRSPIDIANQLVNQDLLTLNSKIHIGMILLKKFTLIIKILV